MLWLKSTYNQRTNNIEGGEIMTLLEKIDYLLNQKNLNKRQLSIQADIPYSTIANWYKRGFDGMTLTVFKKLCTFFEVDMTSMAYDELEIKPYDPEAMYTTEHEREVILRYRASDYIDKTSVDRTLGVDPQEKENDASSAS